MQCRICGKEDFHDGCSSVTCRGDTDLCCECCLRGFGMTDPLGDVVSVELYEPALCVVNHTNSPLPDYIEKVLLSELKNSSDGTFSINDIPVKENPNIAYTVQGEIRAFVIDVQRIQLRPRGYVPSQVPDYQYSPRNTSIFCPCSREILLKRSKKFGFFFGCEGYKTTGCKTTIPASVVNILFEKINQNPTDQRFTVTSVFLDAWKEQLKVKRWEFKFMDLCLFDDDACSSKSVEYIEATEDDAVGNEVSEVDIEKAEPHLRHRYQKKHPPSPRHPRQTPPPKPTKTYITLDKWVKKEEEA